VIDTFLPSLSTYVHQSYAWLYSAINNRPAVSLGSIIIARVYFALLCLILLCRILYFTLLFYLTRPSLHLFTNVCLGQRFHFREPSLVPVPNLNLNPTTRSANELWTESLSMIPYQRKHERNDFQFDTDALELCRDTFRPALYPCASVSACVNLESTQFTSRSYRLGDHGTRDRDVDRPGRKTGACGSFW
jgi:hypothetical protein